LHAVREEPGPGISFDDVELVAGRTDDPDYSGI
jgi:hypothetical protein